MSGSDALKATQSDDSSRLAEGTWWPWLFPLILCLLCTGLLLVSTLLFHTLVELFAVGIALMVFVVSWNTYSLSRNNFLMLLGCGYLWVGLLDLQHTLTFDGVALIPGLNPGATIDFWIAARLMEAGVVLLACLSFRWHLRPVRCLALAGLLSLLASIGIYCGWAPALYSPESGLLPLKIWMEYGIVALFLLALGILLVHRSRLERRTWQFVAVSILLTVAAELYFTLYANLSDLPLIIGHYFKLLSFWLIYLALVDAALLSPIRGLTHIVDSFDSLVEYVVIVNREGRIQQMNQAVARDFPQLAPGQLCHEALHPPALSEAECPLCQAIARQLPLSHYEFLSRDGKRWYEVSLSPITLSGNISTLVQTSRDVTHRRLAGQRLDTLNQMYWISSQASYAVISATGQAQLLQKVVDIAVESGSFRMAWIGMLSGTWVKPEYIAGDDQGYFEQVQMRIDDSKWASGPVGRAAKSGQVHWVNNTQTDPDFEPWRAAALQRGFGSLAAVPILVAGGSVQGILTLYAEKPDMFSTDMVALLEQVSLDLQFGLAYLDNQARRREAEMQVLKLSRAVEQSASAVCIVDTEGRAEYINQAFLTLTGYSREDCLAVSNPYADLDVWSRETRREVWRTVSAGNTWFGEVANRHKAGHEVWTLQTVSPIKDEEGHITHVVASGTDNTELHNARETIEKLAYYDPLTGLANRRYLGKRMQSVFEQSDQQRSRHAVLLFDLDDFKLVNDTWGHEAGDQLLKHISESLQAETRPQDTVARMGGDEFVILLEDVPDQNLAARVSERILQRLSKPLHLEEARLKVSSSIGIAMYPEDGLISSDLLRCADQAMYRGKLEGKNQYRFFSQADQSGRL